MRSLDELRFIAARVIEHCRANPPQGPLLGEPAPRQPKPCKKGGHTAGRTRSYHCIQCDRDRKTRRRSAPAPLAANGGTG